MICFKEENNTLREQNDKLWEQDIILREQNNCFSRMALISHRTNLNKTIIKNCRYLIDKLFRL